MTGKGFLRWLDRFGEDASRIGDKLQGVKDASDKAQFMAGAIKVTADVATVLRKTGLFRKGG